MFRSESRKSLQCDGCGAVWDEPAPRATEPVRQKAQRYGWYHVRGLDMCPECRGDDNWRPIGTAPPNTQLFLGHDTKKWVRFGRYYSDVGKWYYSGTSERSQWAQVEGDEPTHWMPMIQPPGGRG